MEPSRDDTQRTADDTDFDARDTVVDARPWGDPTEHETWKSGERDDGSRWRELSAPPADRDDETAEPCEIDDTTGTSEATQDYAHALEDLGAPGPHA